MANRTLDVRGGPEKQTSRNATDMFGSRVSHLIHLSFQLRISVADTTSWEQVAVKSQTAFGMKSPTSSA